MKSVFKFITFLSACTLVSCGQISNVHQTDLQLSFKIDSIEINKDFLSRYYKFSISPEGLFVGINHTRETLNLIDLNKKEIVGVIDLGTDLPGLNQISGLTVDENKILFKTSHHFIFYDVSTDELRKIKYMDDAIINEGYQYGKMLTINLYDNIVKYDHFIALPTYSLDYLNTNQANETSHKLTLLDLETGKRDMYSIQLEEFFKNGLFPDLDDIQSSVIDSQKILYSFRASPRLYLIDMSKNQINASSNVSKLPMADPYHGSLQDYTAKKNYLANSPVYYWPDYHPTYNLYFRVGKGKTSSNSIHDRSENSLLIFNENLDLIDQFKLPQDVLPSFFKTNTGLFAMLNDKENEDYLYFIKIDFSNMYQTRSN